MNIVLGATGNIGQQLLKMAHELREPTVFLTRNPQRMRSFYPHNKFLFADLNNLSSLKKALTGGHRLFLVSPNTPDMYQQQVNAIVAAKEKGIHYVVKISSTPGTVSLDSASDVGRQHWQIEQQLKSEFAHVTILRCHFFMQNLLEVPAAMLQKSNTLRMPFSPDTTFCFLDTQDIAACVVRLLNDRPAGQKVIDLSGQPASFREMVDYLARLTGRNLKYRKVPLLLAGLIMWLKGTPRWKVHHQMQMSRLFEKGIASAYSSDVESLLGRTPIALSAFLERNIAAFQSLN